MAKKYLNLIDGAWIPSESGETFKVTNPANTKQVLGVFPKSNSKDVDRAVKSARKAYAKWRLVPPPKRSEILLRASLIFEKRKEELAKIMTQEMGKVLQETRGDVQETIDMAQYLASEGRRLHGRTTTSELKNKMAMSIRMPIGVCGLITPWNFPMAIPSWKSFPALVCGNTIVIKPAEDTPISVVKFAEILEEAGLPKGVFNIVNGDGEVGKALVEHPDVNLISFTGSSETGREVASKCGRDLKRCSLEMGGKNAQIVLEDADLDLAVEGALWGAFGTTGQRCTATSRIYVHVSLFENFRKKLIARAKKIKIGDGLNLKNEMGPLINQMQFNKVDEYIRIAESEGAKIECGGKKASGKGLDHGYFYLPTVITQVDQRKRVVREEIFGPVVCLMTINNLEEALEKMNDCSYGLSSSVYTRDVNAAMRVIRDAEAGITYINGPTIGAEVHMPFGGVKNTGNGHREAGDHGIDIFSEWKSVYIDYSGKLQKAQIDTE